MDPIVPYIACVIGCAGLYLMLRPGQRAVRVIGGLFGMGVFAWLLIAAASLLSDPVKGDDRTNPEVFFSIFSLIAVASAARMISHQRPVYAALYFVMVVLSSAGLFLMLQAEFMAFALVIVYAGAILITYMFVLMLAQQAPDDEHPDQQPDYDRIPREPFAAVVVGFIMLALLTRMTYEGTGKLPAPPTDAQATLAAWQQLEKMPKELNAVALKDRPGGVVKTDTRGHAIFLDVGKAVVQVNMPNGQTELVMLPDSAMPSNVQGVGLELIQKFPVSLELAGVILLMAMFGAVVLARKQIELGEDEVREAAGMRRLALHSEDSEHIAPVGGNGGGVR
jgi:NADH-quinone oxidoreductase subunit J